MPRLPDFRSRIFQVISDYEGQAFAYGKRDCALFGADIVRAISGVDPAEAFRGKYRSLSGGLKIIRKAGYKNQADWLTKNAQELPIAFAQFGDLVVIDADGDTGFAIGVVGGAFIIALRETGLVRIPLTSASTAYRIGESI